jgi:hypothetical protein
MNIIARKSRNSVAEYIVVARGEGIMPFVVGTADEVSLKNGEWYWGHYFATLEDAMEYFNEVPVFVD